MMVRTMSESMMRRVAGRCGAHRLQAPSGARLHGSTGSRVHGHGKGPPPGEAGEGPFPCPEPVVVTSPSILTYTKEPHLRSSNLNFFSPTIGVRFSFGREGGRHLAAGAKEKAGRGGSVLPPGLSTGLPWPYFLCRAVSVWFPRRRNSINPTPKSANAANATMGADTPVLASWRIVFTMAGVAGGMYELVNSGRVPVVVTMPGIVDGLSPTASPLVLSVFPSWWRPRQAD